MIMYSSQNYKTHQCTNNYYNIGLMSGSLHLLTSETIKRDDKSQNLECRMVSLGLRISFTERI